MEKIKTNGFHKWLTPYLTISINGYLMLGGDELYPHLDLYNHYGSASIDS
jgi:hypothetical protein